jgi:3-deoxy-7-phosphoheptulonate synthase
MTKTGKKITKIARAAGQFSKPRTNDFEVVNGSEVPAYKGDMINRENIEQREPDPHLMIRAYNQCSETLNLLRALSSSHKYSNINIFNWKTEFQSNIYRMNLLGEILNKIQSSVNVLSSSELDESRSINSAQIYTGHEGMLLNYEESLTRKDRFTDKYYDCSSHFLWIGERTRQLDCGHVEFFRGIHNPIGIKISHKVKPWELVNLIFILNPQNERGKICLITRMGSHIEDYLPELIDIITKYGLNVIWVCDPMHGNGKNVNGIKTRYYNDIKKEVDAFFTIHYDKGTIPGGIHLEMTGNDVTECLGGSYMMDVQNETFLRKNYLSSCDPRLNFFQTIELIDHISNIIV